MFAQPGDLELLGARSLEGLNLRVDSRAKKLVAGGPILAAARTVVKAVHLWHGAKINRCSAASAGNGTLCQPDVALTPNHQNVDMLGTTLCLLISTFEGKFQK